MIFRFQAYRLEVRWRGPSVTTRRGFGDPFAATFMSLSDRGLIGSPAAQPGSDVGRGRA
jgi:hypothetical protein